MNRIKKVVIRTLLLLGIISLDPIHVLAQGNEATVSTDLLLTTVLVLIGFIIVILIIVILSLQSTRNALIQEEDKRRVEQKLPIQDKPGWWSILMKKLTRAVPVEREKDVLLDHNYDGIRELDNHLPPWWTYLFYITIAFGIVYLLVYHVFQAAPLQAEEYEIAMEEAANAAQARQAELVASGEAFDESTIEFSNDPAILASGETIFNRQCAACHREDGGGGIGPNLTDKFWIHGGSIEDIYRTIKVGVPDKGMISWEPVLSPEQMRDVSSYILTLQGTNPESAKAPQGEPYEAEPAEPDEPDESDELTEPAEAVEAIETVEVTM